MKLLAFLYVSLFHIFYYEITDTPQYDYYVSDWTNIDYEQFDLYYNQGIYMLMRKDHKYNWRSITPSLTIEEYHSITNIIVNSTNEKYKIIISCPIHIFSQINTTHSMIINMSHNDNNYNVIGYMPFNNSNHSIDRIINYEADYYSMYNDSKIIHIDKQVDIKINSTIFISETLLFGIITAVRGYINNPVFLKKCF